MNVKQPTHDESTTLQYGHTMKKETEE